MLIKLLLYYIQNEKLFKIHFGGNINIFMIDK